MREPLVLVLLAVIWLCRPCAGQSGQSDCVTIPGHHPLVYAAPADVDFGALFFGRDFSTETSCADTVTSSAFAQISLAILYATTKVNDNPTLLPNLTLGYVITDDCYKGQTGLGSVMTFISPGLCNTSFYDVVGLVTVTTSSSAVVYGNFLNLFHIPMVGAVSSAESLSEKNSFKYFVRVIPSDFYQAKAMVSIVLHFNWTYVSTIYSEGDYGVNGIRAVHTLAAENDICVAYSKEILRGSGQEVFDSIVESLVRKKNARAVLAFTQTADGVELLRAIERAGYGGHFVIIGSDGLSTSLDTTGIERVFDGALCLQPVAVAVPDYVDFYNQLTITANSDPWMKLLYTTTYGCSWDETSENQCDETMLLKDSLFPGGNFVVTLTIDAVNALAHALHNYFSDKCPAVFKDKTGIKGCFMKEEFLHYIYSVNFTGTSGETLRFDERGDAEGKYQVNQRRLNANGMLGEKVVGVWDKSTSSLDFFEPLAWSDGQLSDKDSRVTNSPISVCSKPCKSGEFLVNLELKCCWECRKCRRNEVVIRNGSACEECELLSWPNQEHFLTCDPIEPSYLQWTAPQTMACLILAVLGLVFSFLMVVLFSRYRHQRLIKATSRELSMLTLSGVILSYVAAIVLLSKPTTISCYTGRICFNLSFSIAYAPLVAKVTRIYRIFAAAKHGTKPPSFISTRSQIVFSFGLISIQAVLSAVAVILYPPDVTLSQPLTTESFVEMLCNLPVTAVMYSLSYNLILMLACSAFAFKARRLPDNFNESRFIFICVCTTLFLWCAFIPSYFSAFYASQKIVLLVSVLLFNSAVMLLCLYAPRIYAVIYLDEEKQGVSGSVAGGQVDVTKSSQASK